MLASGDLLYENNKSSKKMLSLVSMDPQASDFILLHSSFWTNLA